MRTKINFFLITVSIIVLFSCENSTDHPDYIPDINVNFSLNILTTPQLQTALKPKYVGSANGEKVGYNGHGIYVTKINSSEFRAFDASCTNEIGEVNHADLNTYLLQKNKNSMLVYCPKCKTVYNLLDGNVQSGTAKYALKEYVATTSGNKVYIRN